MPGFVVRRHILQAVFCRLHICDHFLTLCATTDADIKQVVMLSVDLDLLTQLGRVMFSCIWMIWRRHLQCLSVMNVIGGIRLSHGGWHIITHANDPVNGGSCGSTELILWWNIGKLIITCYWISMQIVCGDEM